MSFEPVYKLREWIPERAINSKFICGNPHAFRKNIQRRKIEDISWNWFSKNTHPGAVHMMEQNVHSKQLLWSFISANPSAIYLLKRHPENINKRYLNSNPEGISLLEENLDWIIPDILACNKNGIQLLKSSVKCKRYYWNNLCSNPSAKAIKVIKKNLSKIDFEGLSKNTNPEVIPIILANLDKCNWSELSRNPIMVPLLKENQHKINWEYLFGNNSEEAMELIHENIQKLDETGVELGLGLGLLSLNPAIFILDKDAMMRQVQHFAEDLISTVLHPTRVHKYMDKYNYNILEDEYCTNDDNTSFMPVNA